MWLWSGFVLTDDGAADRFHPDGITRRRVLAGVSALGLTALAGGARDQAVAATAKVAPGAAAKAPPPTTELLAVSGPGQPRWLSVPMSRIVVNPYDFNQTSSELEQNSGPELPLSVGYYAHNQATRVPSLLSLYVRPDGEPDPKPPAVAFADDFDDLSPQWSAEPGVVAATANSRLTMTLPDSAPNPWGALSRTLTVDVDAFPVVTVDVTSVAGAWALKVNEGDAPVDTVLQGDTTATGAFSYDLRRFTGWSGTRAFTLRLFVVQKNAPLVVDRIAVQAEPTSWLEAAKDFSTTWRPQALEFFADYASGGGVRGRDQFHDAESLTRVLAVRDVTGGRKLMLAGRFTGEIALDGRGVVTVRAEAFSYSVTVGRGAQIRYYANETDLRAGGPELEVPPPSGCWGVVVPAEDRAVGLGFAYAGEASARSAQRALDAARPDAAARDQARWTAFWNAELERVPRPGDFTLPGVPANGVGPDDVAATYYRAWHFLAANTLPEAPEVGYHHPQVATGKPSMWNYGADGARPSASWDSLLGIQYLGYLRPDVAWASFAGLMSLVDADGKLGGESLPSRKAQTAWMLYAVTGDRARLTGIYADLRRYLLWAQENPRWIFGDHDIPDERDAEFVVSLIVDFGYAERIADVVGEPGDVPIWRGRKEQLTRDYGNWFFPAGGISSTLQYHYLKGSHADSPGNTLWVCTGLHLPQLTARQRSLLTERFMASFSPVATLAGFGFPDVKAPDVTYTTYGLLENGMAAEADVFVQANIRDIVRAGSFAEVYDDPPSGPVGTGVRPSMFGAVNLVDFVWLRNGCRADDGTPVFVRMSGDVDGGLSGLTYHGRTFDVEVDGAAGMIRLSGAAIAGTPRCRQLPAPVGTSVPLPDSCAR
ncbi:hypothetical protein SAMN04489717_0775 [Actinopolymorpha singaporensis]|uniref:Alpha-L-rhamnosidase six-hairpin glycosidase domain-containing protein n=1 Tax=Actinopolymorpha singaporensis TaxID=117157 RepID=A0A1H1MCT2_9ACTN|nr:hypothetical protein SAMN04489717_0775 [Actinopolymorpha singaporensis]